MPLYCLLASIGIISTGPATVSGAELTLKIAGSESSIRQYEPVQFQVEGVPACKNPFDPNEIDLSLRLTGPDGVEQTLPAFWIQEYERRTVGPEGRKQDWLYPVDQPGWQGRFAPVKPGVYRALAQCRDRTGLLTSSAVDFRCVPSTSPGFLRVSRKDPRFMEFADGKPFFPLGQNLAFIGEQQYVTLSKAESIFASLGRNGANYLRIWTGCEDWALAIEARKSAWGRSWDWRPPLVPMPTAPNDTNSRCLKLTTDKPSLSMNPSHRVALRANTSYVLALRTMSEGDSRLSVTTSAGGRKEPVAWSPAPDWQRVEHTFRTGPDEWWLEPMTFRVTGNGTVWLADVSLRASEGGPELLWEADVNRPIRGFYNPLDCFMLDEIVRAAEKNGQHLQLCLLTRDLYMSALKEPGSAEYKQAIADAQNFMRYAIARWGYSTSVAAWEYWNEMNPGLPTDPFYSALGEFLERTDVYHHLRTTSTWGPSAKDCRHPKLDIADVHFYLRPADRGRLRDEVDAVLERTRWIREQAPVKPAHLGEFGLADDQWRITEDMKRSPDLSDVHNGLWASALSGASGSAMPWWWERIDQRDGYTIYQPLAAFIRDVPWTSGEVRPAGASLSDDAMRAIGLQAGGRAWVWIFHPDGAWAKLAIARQTPATVQSAELKVRDLADGKYRVRWWDTRTGKVVQENEARATAGQLPLAIPAFTRDIACQLERVPE